METRNWMLVGVNTILITMVLMFLNMSLKRVDNLIDEVQKLAKSVVVNKNALRNISEKDNQQDQRLNKHSERLRELEINK